MKLSLFVLLLLAILTGCHDKEPAPVPEPTLVGTWRYATTTTLAAPRGGGAGTTSVYTYQDGGPLLALEPRGISKYYTVSGNYSSPELNYSWQGDVLILDGPGSSAGTYKVLSLTQQELVLQTTSADALFLYTLTHRLTRVL